MLESGAAPAPPVHILLVEDDLNDAELACEVFRQINVPHEVHRVDHAEGALTYLSDLGPAGPNPRPGLVILDLRLPQQSGFDVLRRLKDDRQLNTIPVLVLTGSPAEKDIWSSYHLHANAYIVKPGNAEGFMTVLRQLAEFYLRVVLLPPPAPPPNRNQR
ncbi:response regulator [Deinococcus peraridilitoris]|uniref:Response regulator with CheY-like receiver domain and winged-helix DNA-binding domain protein n=1 Tax=Deinococcus peraridilitoris (strain DSM 19664 / LMG 22246 / CIP 109416 / KR-200) TaxID=937777 RepID=L0A684_DEIPD|nr:response regulator [Deinococcus peraridilitoris]AFZ68530.1 response regulator with CheY-like receiver domain and winged-helix DNA-binding domain protein [Deinococcus peraridilitoris DSM 19664]